MCCTTTAKTGINPSVIAPQIYLPVYLGRFYDDLLIFMFILYVA